MKKTGLGKDPLSWITNTSKTTADPPAKRPEIKRDERKAPEKTDVPKFKTFEIRLTSLLREDQLEFLEKLVRDIQKNRTTEYKKERITKNTIIRAFIDAFMQTGIDIKNIPDEAALLQRIQEKIRK